MRINKITPYHHSQLLLALCSFEDSSVQDGFCHYCENKIPKRVFFYRRGIQELPVDADERAHLMAVLICEKYVDLLIKALTLGFLEEKEIDALIEMAAIPIFDTFSISPPQLTVWVLSCRVQRGDKRKAAANQLRKTALKRSEPWVYYQNSFTQYASIFYDILDTASANEEEFNHLHQTCVDLGLKMIRDSSYLKDTQRKSGERIFIRLTEKSTATKLYRRASGAEMELKAWLEYAQKTYDSYMALMERHPIYVKLDGFNDYHYIARYEVTILASEAYYHLQKFAQLSVQTRSDYFQGLNAYTCVQYNQIYLVLQEQLRKREKEDKIISEEYRAMMVKKKRDKMNLE